MKTDQQRNCPVCGENGHRLFLDENIAAEKIGQQTYASRKKPEFMRHKLVECLNCACVYAPIPPTRARLMEDYSQAPFESGLESSYAAQTYIEALAPYLAGLPKSFVMDVGASDGAFLKACQKAGIKRLLGIEPSRDSIEKADPEIREFLKIGMFSGESFPEDEPPGLITSFMTLEHMDDPLEFAALAHTHLEEGGILAVVAHNYRGIANRLLGKRSPIIDIEHLQLFCPKAMTTLFEKAGFRNIMTLTLANRYPLGYWLKLSPLGSLIKDEDYKGIFRQSVALPVGNFIMLGVK